MTDERICVSYLLQNFNTIILSLRLAFDLTVRLCLSPEKSLAVRRLLFVPRSAKLHVERSWWGGEADAKKARLKLVVLLVSAASTKGIRKAFDRHQESLYILNVGSFWIFIARLFE